MPTQSRNKKQVRSERRAIKKLRALGLYNAKIDLRKKPTAYQRKIINKYADVVAGRATVVKPKDAASYKNLFPVIGDKVIVPRRKGEKIKVTKRGAIVTERKIGTGKNARTVRSRFKKIKHRKDLHAGKRKMFFVPFIKGKDKNGKPILQWKRFPSLEMLKSFMEGYDYKDWTNYVVEEYVDAKYPYTNSAELDRKLGKAKRKKIRFADDDDEE